MLNKIFNAFSYTELKKITLSEMDGYPIKNPPLNLGS